MSRQLAGLSYSDMLTQHHERRTQEASQRLPQSQRCYRLYAEAKPVALKASRSKPFLQNVTVALQGSAIEFLRSFSTISKRGSLNLQQASQSNRLLALLPEAEYLQIAPHFRVVNLSLGQILHEPAETISTVYFPTHAMISLVQIVKGGTTLESGVVGNDGMLGYPVYLGGGCSSSRAIVQISGEAIALDALVLKKAFDQGKVLQKLLLLYTQAFITQVSQTAVCNRFHVTEARLARWLLQSQDCTQSSSLNLTQAFLSSMLGTRRASVTTAAGGLQQAGLIRYSRGQVQILDREALKTACCECYNIVKTEYARLL